MNPQLPPAHLCADAPAWMQTVVAFLAEKERRSGSRRTVEGYARMLWPFFDRVGSPELVTPAHIPPLGLTGSAPREGNRGGRRAVRPSPDGRSLTR